MTYVYILRSLHLPERYYVGVTADLRSRLQRHSAMLVSFCQIAAFTAPVVTTAVVVRPRARAIVIGGRSLGPVTEYLDALSREFGFD